MWPDKTRAELPVMPKGRYAIMLRHMPRVGDLGLDMMLRTCTIQVNLDYASEADMVKKSASALRSAGGDRAVANSPLTEGKPNGFKSFRSHIWEDTDPHRTGMLPLWFEDGFGTSATATMRSTYRCISSSATAKYIDVAARASRFLDGKLPQLPGEKPRLSDFIDHLSTAFPEVRLKSFLENARRRRRRWSRICALPALWVGLLYADEALDAAWERVRHWSLRSASSFATTSPRMALDAPVRAAGRCMTGARSDRHRLARPYKPRRAQCRGRQRRRVPRPLTRVVASGMTRPTACSRNTTANGAGTSPKCMRK